MDLTKLTNNQNHKSMKNVILIFVACMMSFVVASCGGNSNSSEADRIAQLEDSIANLNNRIADGSESKANNDSEDMQGNDSNNNHVGTYEFTDTQGHKFVLVLNEDETATIQVNDLLRYGTWELYSPIGNLPLVAFNFDEMPQIALPNGEKKCQFLVIVGNYIYEDWHNVKSKNPRYRLPIKKIK